MGWSTAYWFFLTNQKAINKETELFFAEDTVLCRRQSEFQTDHGFVRAKH